MKMVEFRKNASRDTLYALAAENGVDVPENADRQTIIDALNAYNAQEAEADSGGGQTDGTEAGTDAGDDNAENGTPDAGDAAESGADDGKGNDAGTNESSAQPPAEVEKKLPAEEADTYVYVGPSIPSGRLKENALFRGTRSDVLEYLAEMVEKYPQIPQLLVPTSRLAVFSTKVKTPGNIAYKHYNDVLSAVRRKER